MDFRPAFLDKVKAIEGFSEAPQGDYKQMSWGYGTRAPGSAGTITKEQADADLQRELGDASAAVATKFPNLPQNQHEALADLTYNAGPKWMEGGVLHDAVANGDTKGAQDAIALYNHAGGKVLPGLTDRRAWNAQHYAQDTFGDASNPPAAAAAAAASVPSQIASADNPAPASDEKPEANDFLSVLKQRLAGVAEANKQPAKPAQDNELDMPKMVADSFPNMARPQVNLHNMKKLAALRMRLGTGA